jgi:hypothetical protein
MGHRFWRFLGAAAIVAGVLAPTAAVAQDYPPGSNTPTATTVAGNRAGNTQTTSTASRGSSLPFTGGEIAALTLVGAGVAGAGVVLVGLGRRRSHSPS